MTTTLVFLSLILAWNSYAATVPPAIFSYNIETGAWTQLAGVPSETFKAAISTAAKEQAARDAKKAQMDATKAQAATTSAETDRKTQIDVAQEAARKANADAAQARSDLKLSREDTARESAAIRNSQNWVVYGQYATTLLSAIVVVLGGLMTAKLNRHMVATAQQGLALGRVEANTRALIAELIEKARQEGKEEGKEEARAEEDVLEGKAVTAVGKKDQK